MKIEDVTTKGYDTLLLDRDGTINIQIINGYVCNWKDFEFIPGVLDTLSRFAKEFKHIFIVTNQRGIGKGLYTEEDLKDIHTHMTNEIIKAGGRIDGIYYCTSLTEEDTRRKPGRGMFDDIISEHPDIKPNRCLMIGDSESDMEFAKNCGIKGILIDSLKKEQDKYYWLKTK